MSNAPLKVLSDNMPDNVQVPNNKWSSIFLDDFDRPDGTIGSNYTTGVNGTPPLNIKDHSVCSNTQVKWG